MRTRTATAPVLIGCVFLALGLSLRESGYVLLKTIPVLSARLQEHGGDDLFLVLLMAAIGVALNPAAASAVGLPPAYAFQHGWVRCAS